MPIFGSTSNKTDDSIPNSTRHQGTAMPPQDYTTMPVGANTMGAGGNRLTHNHQPEVMGQHPQGGMMNERGNGAAGTNMTPTTGMGHHAGGTGHHAGGLGHHDGAMGSHQPQSPTGEINHTDPDIPSPESSLKAKGIQKEQEGKVVKVQSSELTEAERLEVEALMRSERAVAHGIHPDNRHLGSWSMPEATQ
ncbi:hypothetical protein C8J56DRAFT_1075989 [Mycena floridula]|nr:hypothetical protein C8J56DRAFT_1075989 [Mycena floridula]